MKADKTLTREILLSLWKIHILHHAEKEGVVGQWMMQELRRHGYEVSPGTMYPLLARMQRNGWLKSQAMGAGAKARREYHLTAAGRRVLAVVRKQLDELRGELSK
jgi:PadR family transcriptional regulator, regulatory protein PadR